MSQNEHALIAISSLYRYLECPGAFWLEKGRERKDTIYSESGTESHALAAEAIEKQELPEDPAVRGYVKFVASIKEMFLVDALVMVEHKVGITEHCWGTTDCAIVWPKYNIGAVIDYKNGVEKVDAWENPQLAGYAVGLAKQWNLDKIYTYIYQPNSLGSDVVSSWELDRDNLNKWEKKIVELGEHLLKTPHAVRKPGGWCQYCRGKAVCPVQEEIATEVATIATQVPTPSSLTPEQLAVVVKNKKMVASFIKAVDEYLLDNPDIEVPGVKRKQGAKKRLWANEEEVGKKLAELGISFKKESLRTVADVEKEIGKDEFAKQFRELIEEKRNKGSIVWDG